MTRTISAAIIALELTGQIQLLFPCLLAVTIACGVSAQLTSSIYDAILSLKGIPLLPVAPWYAPCKSRTFTFFELLGDGDFFFGYLFVHI